MLNIQQAQKLRETLDNHGYKIDDKMATLTILSAIEYVDLTWVHMLEHDFNRGNLSWPELTSLCMARGNMQSTRIAFAADTTANPTGQDESQPQQTARYDDSLECEKCGKPGYAQKDCWDCNGVPSDFRGGGRGRGRGNASRGRGGRARGGHQNTTSELDGSLSQPQPQPSPQPSQQPLQQPPQQPQPQKPNQQQQQKPTAS